MEKSSDECHQISGAEVEELHQEYVVGDCPKENDDSLVVKEGNVQEVFENVTTESELSNEDKFNLIVFVGNLAEETTVEDVKKLFFREIGLLDSEVVDVSMLWKVKKDSKELGFTFVEFVSKQAFEKALTLNNSFQFGQSLLVLPSVKTHCGLFLMKNIKPECKKDVQVENMKLECKKDEKVENMEPECKNDEKVENMEPECKKDENVENIKPECKKDVQVTKTGPENSPDNDFVPVHKKSDHVAYLKNLPPDSTKDNVLQFLNLTWDDVIDIHIIQLKQKKSNSKPKKVRAVIAFPSEENLGKCLSQTSRMFENHCVDIERHIASKPSINKKQTSKPNDAKEKSASPRKQESNTASMKDSNNAEKLELDLFLKHVNWIASEHHIREFFGSVGAKVVGIKQFSDSGAKVRGMGFVSMANKKSLLKGLALNGVIFLGNKIKVSIRNDRKFLMPPIKGEAPRIYSTFFANLPMKISAAALRTAVLDYLKQGDYLVESVYVPLAVNHSGNRGYAFVIFQDEKSLMNALKLNGTEIHICKSNVTVTVSKNWPQNPKETSDATAKPKEHDYRQVNTSSEHEFSRNGRLLKRKRKAATSPHRGEISKGYRNPQKKMALHVSSPVGYAFEPSQPRASSCDVYNSNYESYRDYLEFRDYVDRKKAFDEQKFFGTLHHRAGHEEQLFQNQKDDQVNFAMTTQSSFLAKPATSFQDRFQKSEERNVENGWRNYSSSMTSRDVSGGYDRQTTPASSYEMHSRIPVPNTTGEYEYLSQPVATTSYSTYDKFQHAASNITPESASKEKLNSYPLVSYPMVLYPSDRYGKVTPSGAWSSTNSQWASSNNANFWDSRDDNVVNSNDTSSRGHANFSTSERGNDFNPSSTSSLGTIPLRSGDLRSTRSDRDLRLYSRLD